MSIWEHAEELRQRLRVIALALLVILIVLVLFPTNPAQILANPGSFLNGSFLRYTLISTLLTRIVADILPGGWTLIAAGGLGEALEVYFVAALVFALAIDIPVIVYEAYKFVDPALKEKERRLVYPFIISSSILFLAGLLFGYFILAKVLIFALAPFFQATQISFSVDAASFYFVVFLVVFASGISFTTPVWIYSVIRLGIVDASFFSKNRVAIWFVLWAVTGLVLTPDGGPLLDLALFIPIVSLLELAVFLAKRRRPATPQTETKGHEERCKFCKARFYTESPFCSYCGKAKN